MSSPADPGPTCDRPRRGRRRRRTRCRSRRTSTPSRTGPACPRALLAEAGTRGFGPTSTAGDVAAWLKQDHDLGRGHAMAFFHVLKNGPTIGDKHVGTTGTHRDDSATLHLDGKAARGR